MQEGILVEDSGAGSCFQCSTYARRAIARRRPGNNGRQLGQAPAGKIGTGAPRPARSRPRAWKCRPRLVPADCPVGHRMGSRYRDLTHRRVRTNRQSDARNCSLNLARNLYSNVRRFVGILAGTCALYLTVGAVDAPCADHGRDTTSNSGSAVMMHHGSHSESPAQKSQLPKPCKTAAIPCCIAMTSCGTTLALGAGASSDPFQIRAGVVHPLHFAEPLTRVAAPEPPPPKA